MFKYLVKNSLNKLLPVADRMKLGHFTKSRWSGLGQILMFHRVVPESSSVRIHNHLSLEITPSQLENTILYFKHKGYVFLSLDELPYQLTNAGTGNRFCVFTFDDGYKDNLHYAFPVLQKHRVPFTIYVTTDFCDGNALPWWYMLEDFICASERINIELGAKKYHFRTESVFLKEYAFERLRTVILQMDDLNDLENVFEKSGFYKRQYAQNLALTWNDVGQIAASGIGTIGSHSVSHPNLTILNEDDLHYQYSESKIRIERITGKAVMHFCYPAGRFGTREAVLAQQCGYITSTTCEISNLFSYHKENLMHLPRIPINHYVSEKYLNLVTTGLLPFVTNKLLRKRQNV